jgi:Raf kinase inhibitor-like YbhB/YbcL family protein
MVRRPVLLAAALVLLGACSGGGELPTLSADLSLRLESQAFPGGGVLPTRFTCDGANVSPPLLWQGEPKPAEFAILLTDPDASGGTFVHWVVFGISGSTGFVEEGSIPPGAREGRNDFGDVGYGGPCPPAGDPPHDYVFTIYGLGRNPEMAIPEGSSPERVLDAIRCCVTARGQLTVTYGR